MFTRKPSLVRNNPMFLANTFNKDNLHHAYLIEGDRELIIPLIHSFLKEIDFKTIANPDFVEIKIDSIKIDDARNIKSISENKSYSNELNSKKVFIISTNSMLLEAQNTLLKIFEEPASNTHYFFILPSVDGLLKTFTSRFYLVKDLNKEDTLELKQAKNFIKLNLKERIDFIKDLISKDDDEEDVSIDSIRSKSLTFLDSLEIILYREFLKSKDKFKVDYFNQLFKVRKYLRQPGSSTKSLLESVALSVPVF